jgi:integrase
MIESVFKRIRLIAGQRLISKSYYGQYSLTKGGKVLRVCLYTPDKEIARKRLRAIILEEQREQEGLIAPKVQRDATGRLLSDHVGDYVRDLTAQERSSQHIKDTSRRLLRIIAETGWKTLRDVQPSSFVEWRTTLSISAKTKKEYQVSLVAFLNWLVQLGKLPTNPLARVPRVEVRGKQVREARAFTVDELQRLFAASPKRALVYQVLLYTGQRKSEIASLVWSDLQFDKAGRPFLHVRESTTKDKKKRIVPLRPELAAKLLAKKRPYAKPEDRIFSPFPRHTTLLSDLEQAGIPHRDGLGRVVHFHSFRKTFQTLGVRYNVNQRSAQAILGHTDANLTANVYTDVPALALHEEIAKYPWIDNQERGTQIGAHDLGTGGHMLPFPGKSPRSGAFKKAAGAEELSRDLAASGTPGQKPEMVDATGLEPVTPSV